MIPKIIHQIFFNLNGKELKDFEVFNKSIEKVKELHKDYKIILWGEEEAYTLIKDEFKEYLDFYENLRYKINKVDFFRFILLYKYGGFYIDLDMIPIKSFEGLRDNKLLFHNIREVKPTYSFIENDFIGSEPNLEFWKIIIKECIENYNVKNSMKIYDTWKGRFILQTIGPKFLSRVIRNKFKDIVPKKIVYSKWHKGSEEDYYVKDYKLNTWVI